jgi:hypothetical protein
MELWRKHQKAAFRGINSQDLFDAEMSKIISGIPSVEQQI